MKNLVIIFILCCSSAVLAQDKSITFGVKAGLNYGDNGKIELQDLENAGINIVTEKGDARTGYHIGMFIRANITDSFFLRPELQYTQTSTSYDVQGISTDYKLGKLDLPILLGVKVLGPLYVMGGPSLQYIVNNDLKDLEISDVKNDFTVGMQFGIGVQLGRLNADVRYERGFSDNQAKSVQKLGTDNGAEIRVDSRANQFILSLGLDF